MRFTFLTTNVLFFAFIWISLTLTWFHHNVLFGPSISEQIRCICFALMLAPICLIPLLISKKRNTIIVERFCVSGWGYNIGINWQPDIWVEIRDHPALLSWPFMIYQGPFVRTRQSQRHSRPPWDFNCCSLSQQCIQSQVFRVFLRRPPWWSRPGFLLRGIRFKPWEGCMCLVTKKQKRTLDWEEQPLFLPFQTLRVRINSLCLKTSESRYLPYD
jgi:hypothetical protein